MWELLFKYARQKTLTEISGLNLLLLKPSCFRNIVLSYFEHASFPSEITCLVLCSMQSWKLVQSLQKCWPHGWPTKEILVCRTAKAVYSRPFSMGFHVLQPVFFSRGAVLCALNLDWGMGGAVWVLCGVVYGNIKFLYFLDLS